jgi:Glycosyl hydrolase family 79 C-terminal beta domain
MASTVDTSVTLQNTPLNYTFTTESIRAHLTGYQSIINDGAPIIVGEANSFFNTGTPNISNSFGAALWTMDYNLWCASQNISHVHMQQGTNFYYDPWQPIDTPLVAKGTLAPYYGSIAAAAMLSNTTTSKVQIATIPMLEPQVDIAYAAYVTGSLARIAVLNLRSYGANSGPRPSQQYTFSVPGTGSTSAIVRKLDAAGSGVLSGITWDGYSYDYALNGGKLVLLPNMTRGKAAAICGGVVSVKVEDAGAVILDFET